MDLVDKVLLSEQNKIRAKRVAKITEGKLTNSGVHEYKNQAASIKSLIDSLQRLDDVEKLLPRVKKYLNDILVNLNYCANTGERFLHVKDNEEYRKAYSTAVNALSGSGMIGAFDDLKKIEKLCTLSSSDIGKYVNVLPNINKTIKDNFTPAP